MSAYIFQGRGVGGNREMKEGGDQIMATSALAPTGKLDYQFSLHNSLKTGTTPRGASTQVHTLPADGLSLKIRITEEECKKTDDE